MPKTIIIMIKEAINTLKTISDDKDQEPVEICPGCMIIAPFNYAQELLSAYHSDTSNQVTKDSIIELYHAIKKD